MADLGHFWSRNLRQEVALIIADTFGAAVCGNEQVARALHFKRILISREDHLRRAVFQAPKLDLLLSHFPLVPPLQNFRKWPI